MAYLVDSYIMVDFTIAGRPGALDTVIAATALESGPHTRGQELQALLGRASVVAHFQLQISDRLVVSAGPGTQRWSGGRGWARTSNPQLRRLMLYPIELRARRKHYRASGGSALVPATVLLSVAEAMPISRLDPARFSPFCARSVSRSVWRWHRTGEDRNTRPRGSKPAALSN